MKLSEYTVPLTSEQNIQVKHDAQARFIVKSGRRTLEDRLTPASSIGGAITVASFMYNGLSMSGGVSWQHPETGKPLDRPSVRILLRPQDVLVGGAECDCHECKRAA
jgi:hypothetical protein